MKKRNYLKGLRVLLAILFFVPILLFFVDFSGVLPDSVHRLLHLQLMPALLGGMVGLIVFQFLLALAFGRIYCSTICPAGVFQDIINRLFCIGKKKKKGSRRFTYHKPMNRLRYVLLVITAVMAVFGLSELCLLLDPYSNFGRGCAGGRQGRAGGPLCAHAASGLRHCAQRGSQQYQPGPEAAAHHRPHHSGR